MFFKGLDHDAVHLPAWIWPFFIKAAQKHFNILDKSQKDTFDGGLGRWEA